MTFTAHRSFNYIVVGAGSAGCVLANRLSVDPAVSVCLVEADPSDHAPFLTAYIRTPAGVIRLIASPKWNWMHRFAAQPGIANQPIACLCGRVWGGFSATNGMIYVYGDRHDYDRWASLGNCSWSYGELLPYFCHSEYFEPDESPQHGRGGELNAATQRSPGPINQVFFQAAEEMGWPYSTDFSGERQRGVDPFHVVQVNGEHCSTAHTFLHPALARPNLTMLNSALTLRVLLEGTRATGVKISQAGEVVQLQARREVVLSAGSTGSPQLLLLSGIGPTAELARRSIVQRHELPEVGRNLQNHQNIVLMYRTEAKLDYGLGFLPKGWLSLLRSPWQYLLGQRGALTSSTVESGGFLRFDPQVETPELGLIVAPVLKSQPQRLVPFGHGVGLHVMVMYPQSRGRARLNPPDPHDRPLIEANFFSRPADLDTLVQGFQLVHKLAASCSFARHLKDELVPGPRVSSRGQIEAWIRADLGTVFHPVGTYKMGHDQLAVVDDQLRVHDLQGLRVADASIILTLITGNTNTPAIMIDEKATDLILGRPTPHAPTEQRRDAPELVEARASDTLLRTARPGSTHRPPTGWFR